MAKPRAPTPVEQDKVSYRTRQRASALKTAVEARLKPKQLKKDAAAPFMAAARWMARSWDPWLDMTAVLRAGVFDEPADLSKVERPVWRENALAYEWLCEAVDGGDELLRALITSPAEEDEEVDADEDGEDEINEDLLDDLGALMSAAHRQASNDDRGSLKDEGIKYVGLVLSEDVGALLRPGLSKSISRGFLSEQTGQLLLPMKYLRDYVEDGPKVLDDLREGLLRAAAGDFPVFLYDWHEHDHVKKSSGLFFGTLPVIVYRHLYTSPSSAPDGHGLKARKRGQAALNGLTQVDGRTIAYSCVMAYWFLCGIDDWRVDDGTFFPRVFFNKIVRFFEDDPERPLVKKILAWWNEQICLPKKSCKAKKQALQDKEEDDLADVLQEMDEDERDLASAALAEASSPADVEIVPDQEIEMDVGDSVDDAAHARARVSRADANRGSRNRGANASSSRSVQSSRAGSAPSDDGDDGPIRLARRPPRRVPALPDDDSDGSQPPSSSPGRRAQRLEERDASETESNGSRPKKRRTAAPPQASRAPTPSSSRPKKASRSRAR